MGAGVSILLIDARPIPAFASPDSLAGFAESKGGAWVITREKDVQNLKLQHEMLAGEPELPWDSAF